MGGVGSICILPKWKSNFKSTLALREAGDVKQHIQLESVVDEASK